MIRRAAAAVFFAAIVILGVEPILVSLPFREHAPRAETNPEYRQFLESVRDRTRAGDSVAILVPFLKWEYGYSELFYRASYVLAGREVLPVVDRRDRLLRENVSAAQYVAAWRVRPPAGQVVLQSHGGVLVKRR